MSTMLFRPLTECTGLHRRPGCDAGAVSDSGGDWRCMRPQCTDETPGRWPKSPAVAVSPQAVCDDPGLRMKQGSNEMSKSQGSTRKIFIRLLLLVLSAAGSVAAADGWTLIADGKAYGVMCLAPETTPTATHAAEELRDHLNLVTGV